MWEQVRKFKGRLCSTYWKTVPCVRVSHGSRTTTFFLNKKFSDEFTKGIICLLHDKEANLVGLREPGDEEEVIFSYSLQKGGNKCLKFYCKAMGHLTPGTYKVRRGDTLWFFGIVDLIADIEDKQ